MVLKRIRRMTVLAAATCLVASASAAGTAVALGSAGPGRDDGVATLEPMAADAAAHDAVAEELKLADAQVPQQAQLQFGAEPLGYVQDAAAQAASQASCAISDNAATALVIAMTWPEVSPSGAPPSPMTLSRYDTQSSLGDPGDRAPGLWFHPGIGMWQLDSAGLGTDFTAAEAIDSQYAADRMAPFLVDKYCGRRNSGGTPAQARAHAWTDWVACREGACEDTYQRALNGITPVEGVDRYGGAEPRRCWYAGAAHDCMFVDPANAQGASWWAAPGGGRSPVAAPFYVIRLDGGGSTELRYWLAQDSGASTDVRASRPFGTNARGGLSWSTGPGLCDLTAWRGDC